MCEEVERDGEQLSAIFKETATYGVENSLKEVWLMDKQRWEFMKDKIIMIIFDKACKQVHLFIYASHA